MRMDKRRKLNKVLLIIAIVLIVVAIITGIIIFIINKNKKNEIVYEDKITANNYFNKITIDLSNKKVKRDNIETSMQNEFGITEDEENQILSSQEEISNFFNDTTFEISMNDNIINITNQFQTKRILIQANNIEDNFNAEKVSKLQDGLYLLQFDTQKRTKAAYDFFQTVPWKKKVENDKVMYIETINDESQTVYGEQAKEEKSEYKSYGIKAMGLDNYQNIIKDNGSAEEITVSVLGYGARISHSFFNGRISENSYDFINNSKEIKETIPQGSRVLEVIKDATSDNVKLMPVVVVNSEGYTTLATIIQAIEYSVQNSDVICYELVNEENEMIDLALENAYKENIPVSCVTTVEYKDTKIYPANNKTTIAISSIDKNSKITSFSGSGEYIDFAAYSTDVEEIFDNTTSVSKWTGSQYSNAHIVAEIALIKSYNKKYTILEVYNILRNYCKDLSGKEKDIKYGYGCPDFSKLTIADIDKDSPEIKDIKYDNNAWEEKKQVQIVAEDNIRIYGWAITNSKEKPTRWQVLNEIKSTLDVTGEIQENGKYYIWVEDSAQNISYKEIEINKIDKGAPTISYNIDTSTLNTDKYVTVTVTAEDKDAGLHEMPYSWDKENWGADNNILKVTENGRYKIYVRDNLENIAEKEIIVNVFQNPIEGVATINKGKIIKSIVVSSSWNGNRNNAVRITFNKNLNIEGWNITATSQTPSRFNRVEYLDEDQETDNDNSNNNLNYDDNQDTSNTENTINNSSTRQGYNANYTVTKALQTNTEYYAWLKDIDGNIKYQTFTISKVDI